MMSKHDNDKRDRRPEPAPAAVPAPAPEDDQAVVHFPTAAELKGKIDLSADDPVRVVNAREDLDYCVVPLDKVEKFKARYQYQGPEHHAGKGGEPARTAMSLQSGEVVMARHKTVSAEVRAAIDKQRKQRRQVQRNRTAAKTKTVENRGGNKTQRAEVEQIVVRKGGAEN